MHTNTVNVVIPTYLPDEKFESLLMMLSKQTSPVEKIIIMNTCEEAGTSDIVDSREAKSLDAERYIKKCAEKCLVETEIHNVSTARFDHGGTRNEGAKYVSENCEFILFMTQDAVPENEMLIENLLKHFENKNVAASYARQMATDSSTIAEKFTREFNYPDEDRIKTEADIETIGIKAFFCSNVCAMYRRSVFFNLNGFINKTIFNEDMVFARKLLKSGYSIAYASKAKVIHTHNYNGQQQYKRNFDLAISQALNPQAFSGISSESEGVKYVINAFKYFVKHLRPFAIIPFGINCVYKYLGYKKGKNVCSLTKEEILKCTSNPHFFDEMPLGDRLLTYVAEINGLKLEEYM